MDTAGALCARVCCAAAVAWEHLRILQDPRTYDWMVRHEVSHVAYDSPLLSVMTMWQRSVVAALGVELWCALTLFLCAAAVFCRGRRARLVVFSLLFAMRLNWIAVHDGNCFQPSDSYIAWNLLVLLAFDLPASSARASALLVYGSYLCACAGYIFSGVAKLYSPSWTAGLAIGALTSAATARPLLRLPAVARAVEGASPALTYAAMGVELLFPALCLCGRRGRWLALLLSGAMHAGVLLLVDVPWISLYMISHHVAMAVADAALRPPPPPPPPSRRGASQPSRPSRFPSLGGVCYGAAYLLLSALICGGPAAFLARVALPKDLGLGKLFHPFAFRRLGISPITLTSYENVPGMPHGFEPFAFHEAAVRAVVAPKAAAFAHLRSSARRALQGAADGLSSVAFHGNHSFAGASSAHAPGTQHHQLVLLSILSPAHHGKHRFLCAGGDGFHLPEAAFLRRTLGIDDAKDVLVAADITVHHRHASDLRCAAPDGAAFAYHVRIDCRTLWESASPQFSAAALERDTGISANDALDTLQRLSTPPPPEPIAQEEPPAEESAAQKEEVAIAAEDALDIVRSIARPQPQDGRTASAEKSGGAASPSAEESGGAASASARGSAAAKALSLDSDAGAEQECALLEPLPVEAGARVLYSDSALAGAVDDSEQCEAMAAAGNCAAHSAFMVSRCGGSCFRRHGAVRLRLDDFLSTAPPQPITAPRPISWLPLLLIAAAVVALDGSAAPAPRRRKRPAEAPPRRARSALRALALLLLAVFLAFVAADLARPAYEAPAPGRGAVLVTGASSGIGRSAALELARRGYTVIAATRRPREHADALYAAFRAADVAAERVRRFGHDAVRADGGGALIPHALDLRDLAAAPASIAALVERLELPLVGIVHAAGVAPQAAIESYDAAGARDVFATNVLGPLELTSALLPLVRSHRSRVVFVGSMAAVFAGPGQLPYSASKAALEGAADSLRREMRAFGSSVSIVDPGSVGGGESRMCAMESVCNMSPDVTTTPRILHALLDERPRSRYGAGPVSGPLALGWQLPASVALFVARPVPDVLLDALLRLFWHPAHAAA